MADDQRNTQDPLDQDRLVTPDAIPASDPVQNSDLALRPRRSPARHPSGVAARYDRDGLQFRSAELQHSRNAPAPQNRVQFRIVCRTLRRSKPSM